MVLYSVCLCAGDIRLVNGSDPSEGRVELFYEGEWGRVLQDPLNDSLAWAAAVAHVACRQAGYPYSEGLQSFGQGSGPVWLVIQSCTGDEERVEQCVHTYGWRSICSFCHDLGVRCRGRCGRRKTHTLWQGALTWLLSSLNYAPSPPPSYSCRQTSL